MRVWFNRTFSSIHSALELIRQGDPQRGYTLVCSAGTPHPAVRAFSDEVYVEPSGLDSQDYVRWCLEFCERQRIDIFVPGRRAARIAAQAELFDALGTRVLCAATGPTLELLYDKERFYGTVRSTHAPAPRWFSCTTFAEFQKAHELLYGSCEAVCIKPAKSVYGIGFRRICMDKTPFDLLLVDDQYQIDVDSLRAALLQQQSFAPLLVMEYLGGYEFSVDCIADQGQLHCAVARRKPLGNELGQYIDPREDIQLACAEIVKQFTLNGFVNIQFREGQEGLRILEVNARMSGGIGMACVAGANLPYLGLAGFDRGYDAITIPAVRPGVRVYERNVACEVPA